MNAVVDQESQETSNRSRLDAILSHFNERQKEAATMPLESCLVLAGAGSGKTSVLTARISWILDQEHIDPERVLAVTFTNKAAEEMRKRLRRLVGDEAAEKMWIGTFHSLCNRILRIEHEAARLPRGFAILDEDGQERIVRQLKKDLAGKDEGDEDDENKASASKIVKLINEAKEDNRSPWDIDEAAEGYPRDFVDVYAGYQATCRDQGLLDFNDLQTRTLQLFNEAPHVLDSLRNKFKTIFVDEFQDINDIQYEWLTKLTGKGACVMAVGDDDQSIYGFRGAKPQYMGQFLKEFAKGRKVALEQNYRSLPFILNSANAVIANNRTRLGKTLFTQQAHRSIDKIHNVLCDNEYEEAAQIARYVKDLINRGAKPKDIAILYRTNMQSRLLEQAMIKEGVNVTVYGGYRFHDRQEIKNLIAYMDLATNIERDISFARIINMPPRGLGERTTQMLREEAKERNLCLLEMIATRAEEMAQPDKKQVALEEFLQAIIALGEKAQSLSLGDFVEEAMMVSGLKEYYEAQSKTKKSKKEQDAEGDRINNLFAFQDNAEKYELDFIERMGRVGEKAPHGGWKASHILPDFMSEIALMSSKSDADMDKKNTVSLMTVHASKGLEFDHVVISGMEDGTFPSRRSVPEGDTPDGSLGQEVLEGLEEERRLCYVALTRAKKTLRLFRADQKRGFGNGKPEVQRPSRFIAEIPEKYVQDVRLVSERRHFQKFKR